MLVEAHIGGVAGRDEGLVAEPGKGDLAAAGERVALGQRHDELLLQDERAADAERQFDRRPDEADVERSRCDVAELILHFHFEQLDLDIGMIVAEGRHDRDERAGIGRRADITDGDLADLSAAGAARHGHGGLRMRQRLLGLGHEVFARRGQAHGALRAVNRNGADDVLERLDLLAEVRA